MDAIVYVRRGRRVACMDWFLFFSFRACPRYGADGATVQQGTPYSLSECNKALLPKPPYRGRAIRYYSSLVPRCGVTAAIPHAGGEIRY